MGYHRAVSEADNLRRWSARDVGVYEVWYLTWNHAATDTGYWLRHVTEVPQPGHGAARAELWFARFDGKRPERTFAFHRRFPLPALSSQSSPFSLTLDGGEHRATLAHGAASGAVAGDGHRVTWDLRWRPSEHIIRQLPDVMYKRGGLGETTVHTPNPRVPMSGTVEIDGEQLTFADVPMGQTHLWGKKHAYAWAWGRCAEWRGGEDAVLETLSVRLMRRGVKLPPISLTTLILGGKGRRAGEGSAEHETIRSVGFWRGLRNRAEWRTGRYAFTAEAGDVRLEAEMTAGLERFVVAPYVDPDGQEVFCANTEIGDARVQVWRKAGGVFRKAELLEAAGRAHFETGGRARPEGVARLHRTLEIGEP